MKLYLISQNHNSGYDTYDSAVVAASSEDEARNINITTSFTDDHDDDDYWKYHGWCKPEYVTVKYIGQAAPDTKSGVILASFNSG